MRKGKRWSATFHHEIQVVQPTIRACTEINSTKICLRPVVRIGFFDNRNRHISDTIGIDLRISLPQSDITLVLICSKEIVIGRISRLF